MSGKSEDDGEMTTQQVSNVGSLNVLDKSESSSTRENEPQGNSFDKMFGGIAGGSTNGSDRNACTTSERKKRSRRTMADDGALDDILGQITSKLTTLSTIESSGTEDSISAFIEVLKCSTEEAQFYLESSAWNVETAVMLWLENNPNPNPFSAYPSLSMSSTGTGSIGSGKRNNSNDYLRDFNAGDFDLDAMQSINTNDGNGGSSNQGQLPIPHESIMQHMMPRDARQDPPYIPRIVEIADLTEGWAAKINKYTGCVYFVHLETGITQMRAPPGYADRAATSTSSKTTTPFSSSAEISSNDPHVNDSNTSSMEGIDNESNSGSACNGSGSGSGSGSGNVTSDDNKLQQQFCVRPSTSTSFSCVDGYVNSNGNNNNTNSSSQPGTFRNAMDSSSSSSSSGGSGFPPAQLSNPTGGGGVSLVPVSKSLGW
mmetsp:Transcript_1823/g.3157  ORF Transcript_1823/g.3157 Transcript_1823/m.3157 type:complete len:428 (+) Transcript_1823:85-1368(+)